MTVGRLLYYFGMRHSENTIKLLSYNEMVKAVRCGKF